MARPYSTRFLLVVSEGSYSRPVPAGYRAVVRCITAANNVATGSALAQVWIAGALVWTRSIPGAATVVEGELRVVAYENEVLYVASYGPGLAITVSGYVFEDAGYQAEDAPPQLAIDPGELPPPGVELEVP